MDSALPAALTRVRRHVDTIYHTLLAADHGLGNLGSELRPLLRSLSGKLHSTLLLSEELLATSSCRDLKDPQDPQDKTQGNRAHLAACHSALDGLSSLLNRTHGPVDAADSSASSLVDVFQTLKIQLDLASHAKSLPALERCLSTKPSPSLSPSATCPRDSSNSDQIHGPQTYQESLDAFSRALEILLDPQFNTRISSYHEYCATVKTRAENCHEYSKSAIVWPGYAEVFWPQCKHLVTKLFYPDKPSSFEHWVLEYCRQQWPDVYGDQALTPTHTLQLMFTVTESSSFSPLHAAAALGLAQLCEHLIDLGADPLQYSPIGTPFYCALVGPKAFLARTENPTLLVQLPCSSVAQAETIELFTRPAIIRGIRETAVGPGPAPAEPFPLATLSFYTCLRLGNGDSFLRMVPHLELDDSFWDMLIFFNFEDFPWVKHPSKRAWAFLNSVLPCLFDFHVARYDELHRPSILKYLLVVMRKWGLDMVKEKPRYCRRIADIDDADFRALVRNAVQLHEREVVFRLIRDPRFDPNTHGPGTRESQGTILHMAVGDDHVALIRDILDAGADVHVRNQGGQTPILAVESIGALELLIQHGANTTDTDADGYNIWHIAAANNDCDLLEWLLANDPNGQANRAACMNSGYTPIAKAMTFPLQDLRSMEADGGRSRRRPPYAAALLLLETSKGKPSFVRAPASVHLPQVAAEWGSLELAQGLLEAGLDVFGADGEGNSALHSLNFAATEELVAFLLSGGPPEINAQGKTPAETIFLAYNNAYSPQALAPRSSNWLKVDLVFTRAYMPELTEHPACARALDPLAYERLLTPRVLASRDSQGRGLWERFMSDIVFQWAYLPPWIVRPHVADSLVTAVKCLVKHGAASAFEREKGQRALEHFLGLVARWPFRSASHTPEACFADMAKEIVSTTTDFSPLPNETYLDGLRTAILCWKTWLPPILRLFSQPLPDDLRDANVLLFMLVRDAMGNDMFRQMLETLPVDRKIGRLALQYLDIYAAGHYCSEDLICERRKMIQSWSGLQDGFRSEDEDGEDDGDGDENWDDEMG
ncbi:hypothetical protein SODALDRAFT_327194 [Sodiomyces alkalinus F11]|uniref:Ankyrin n=1 Tax=Sodiomyces alkalinus (strain CBS 110278 / VKM F-3762 / F11) TaxID=1314773 RepID=A0A3N2Q8F1_SODAK|nr:hypothetical protein SODALDRAFT_327194 [Sodiomyces alkalinus F11]ROT43020.1 hypothetical protein SODALDRAFT_327194 [Sodiomyces alkalinus F11]